MLDKHSNHSAAGSLVIYGDPVSTRLDGKPCVLCGAPSTRIGEHVWPLWFIRDFHGQGPFKTEKSGIPVLRRNGTPVSSPALPGAHSPMCTACNTNLNTIVEEPAKPVVRKLLPWSATHEWPTLQPEEATSLARWLLKVGLLLAHPNTVHDNPQVDRDPEFPRVGRVERRWLTWMRDGVAPPDDFSIYVARRSLLGETPWTGDQHRIILPAQVVVDGESMYFNKWSFGLRGVDVTIVWHPGWPIAHLQVDKGRVAKIWPGPAAVDLAALPEVHPDELRFVVGLGVRYLTAEQFRELVSSPLSVDSDPIASFFGDLLPTT